MLTVIINDCRDPNAMGRQMARVGALFGGTVVPVGVENDLEAAGCLVDELDAIGGQEGLILVNVAPRYGKAKKWPNGSPFGYFYYQRILVLSSLDGLTLSLAKKLGILPSTIHFLVDAPKDIQFRSFEFLPYVARDILEDSQVIIKPYPLAIPDPPKAIWYIDCFGNAKTTLLPKDVNFKAGIMIETMFGSFPCYTHLADVPDNGEPALIIGSSGLKDKRFLEIVVQGGSAAEMLGLQVGHIL